MQANTINYFNSRRVVGDYFGWACTQALKKSLFLIDSILKLTPSSTSLTHYAVAHDLTGLLKLLIEWGCDVYSIDSQSVKPIHLAALKGNLSALKMLVERSPNNIDCPDGVRRTPLNYAVQNGNTEIIEYLLQHRANVNSYDLIRATPLHTSIIHQKFDAVKCLLNHQADINACDYELNTAFYLAHSYDNQVALELLFSLKVPSREDLIDFTHHAIKQNSALCAKYISVIGFHDKSGKPFLVDALQKKAMTSVGALLKCGAEFRESLGEDFKKYWEENAKFRKSVYKATQSRSQEIELGTRLPSDLAKLIFSYDMPYIESSKEDSSKVYRKNRFCTALKIYIFVNVFFPLLIGLLYVKNK